MSANYPAPGVVDDGHEPTSGGSLSSALPQTEQDTLTQFEPDDLGTPRPKGVKFKDPSSSPEQARRPSRRQTDDNDDDDDHDDHDDADYGTDERRHSRRNRDVNADRRRDDVNEMGRGDVDVYDGTASDGGHRRRRRRRHRDTDRGTESDGQVPGDGDRRRRHRRHRDSERSSHSRRNSVDSAGSGETEVLPPRFDSDGRKMPERGEDPITDKIQDILAGKGTAGGIFKRLTSDFMGDDKKRRR